MPFGGNPLVPILTVLFIKDVDVYVCNAHILSKCTHIFTRICYACTS